jgi:uncharacterized protein (TIGR03435 family)
VRKIMLGRNTLLAAGIIAAAFGQPPSGVEKSDSRGFEVASIKRTDPAFFGWKTAMPPDDSRVIIEGLTLKEVIQWAYDPGNRSLASNLVSGGPNWYEHDRYDILAKPEGSHIPSGAERKRMLQTLIEERFNLKYHRELKMTPALALFIAKKGARLKESTPGDGGPHGVFIAPPVITGRNASMNDLAAVLQRLLAIDPNASLPVVDRSELRGRFDFDFTFTTGEEQHNGGLPGNQVDAEYVFVAIHEQLGLELKRIRAPLEAIVVDHVERPSAN